MPMLGPDPKLIDPEHLLLATAMCSCWQRKFFWELVSLLTAGVLLAAGVLADSWSSSGSWCPCWQAEFFPCSQRKFFWQLVFLLTAGVLPLLTEEVLLAAGVLANSWSSSLADRGSLLAAGVLADGYSSTSNRCPLLTASALLETGVLACSSCTCQLALLQYSFGGQ
jgi:hypothetical protein